MPDAPKPLLLEGYHFLCWLAETPLACFRLYEDISTGAIVLAKEIRPEISMLEGFAEAFEERVSRLAEIDHPNLLRVIAYGKTAEGNHFIIREHAEGPSLGELMQAGPMDAASASRVVTSIANALGTFHQRDLVHGSLCPSGAWICDGGEAKLDAFPVSSLLKPDQLVRLLGLGALGTMPPEIISGGEASVRGDIHSLGALHFGLLTGAPPRGPVSQTPHVPGLDVRVGHAIAKALSPEPARRQASIAEYLAPLEQVMNGAVAPAPQGDHPAMRTPTMTLIPVLVMVALVASVAAIGWYIWERENAPADGGVVVQAEDSESPGDVGRETIAPEAGAPVIRWHAARDAGEAAELSFILENPAKVLPMPAGESGPDPRFHFEDTAGNNLGEARKSAGEGDSTVLLLSLPHSQPVPGEVRLVIAAADGGSPLVSNPVPLDLDVISWLRLSGNTPTPTPAPEPETAPETEPEPEAEPAGSPAIRRLPVAPAPVATAGDAFIYAAHFFLGEELGLLKLEFGNAGAGYLTGSALDFQCAFSVDTQLDDLLPAGPGAFPEQGLDVAAGGFSAKWLGLDRELMVAGKKLWTKHTFRIDVSDPEIRAKAKYLVVKISPNHGVSESNYLNNTIAIPLDHPDEWHSVTQDPADAKPAEVPDPDPAPE